MVPTKKIVRIGVIAGVVTIFLAMVGLIGNFTELNLIGGITFALLMLLFPPGISAYGTASPRVTRGEVVTPTLTQALVTGAVLGAVAGSVFAAAVAFVDAFGVERVREVFINVSPDLMEYVTFGQPIGLAVLINIAIAVAAASAGGALRVAPPQVRRPVVTGVAVALLLGFLQRIVPIMLDRLDIERDWLYDDAKGGLTWLGAIVTGGIAAGAVVLRQRRSRRDWRSLLRPDETTEPSTRSNVVRIAWLVALVALVGVAPYLLGPVISEVLGLVMVFALLGLGLNIVVGYAGLLDLGYVFFFAIGAYSLALLTGATLNTFTGSAAPVVSADLNFYVAIPIVMLIAAGAGLLIGAPVLRLRGDYLALVTLGLGEVVTVLVRSPWLEPLVGGPNGMRGVPDAAIAGFGFRDPQRFYYLALAFVLFAMFISWRLIGSRIGRAWTAMREDEQIAEAMGISTTRYKLLAFALGGAIGSLGGALFAVKIGSLTPASFEIMVSIQVLGIVILGGIGSIPGVVVGALVLVGLPGVLREFEEYRLLAYGAALVAVMLLRPQGLIPNVRRSRELHEDEVTQDAWQQIYTETEATEPPPEAEPST